MKVNGFKLTDRELQVLPMLHLTNKEIAANIGVSYPTAKEYVGSVIRTFHANNRTHAMILAIAHGVIANPVGLLRKCD